MERREEVKVKSGREYDHLFPRAMLTSITKKKGATVADTIQFIPQVVQETRFHTEKIARVLKKENVPETCKAIWQFVYDHIAYMKDEDGKEQIRSPARTWHDRGNIQGVDCDCYTVFISSILSNLKIRHKLRITKYKEDRFQHIYPIVPLKDGSYITIDCVVRNFDYEEPYSEKKDTDMDLEYLNGLVVNDRSDATTDARDLIGIYDDAEAMAELGRLFKRRAGAGSSGSGKKKGKFKEVLKKGLHLTNRLNPATVLLRAGILASAKLNVFKISQRLKYAYLSDEEAKKRGVDMVRFEKLKKIREKLENIFYGAGGKPENLKKAVLTGKGNKNHDVSGLGYTPDEMEGMNEYTPVSTLLGADIFQNEISEAMQGLGQLGEPATAASIAAASGVIGAISALLKSIGNIFPGKDKDSKDFEDGGSTDAGADAGSDTPSVITDSNKQVLIKKAGSIAKKAEGDEEDGNSKSNNNSGANDNNGKPAAFWENNKKWIKPTAIGITGLGLMYAGYRAVKGKEKAAPAKPMTGIPSHHKPAKKGGKKAIQKSKKQKKQAVALL